MSISTKSAHYSNITHRFRASKLQNACFSLRFAQTPYSLGTSKREAEARKDPPSSTPVRRV